MTLKAHRIDVTVTEDHEVVVKLPRDFPVGAAEVIVLAVGTAPDQRTIGASGGDAFARRFPGAGTMGPVILHESAVAPINEEDWPESLR